MKPDQACTAVIVAAGSAVRMQGIDKMLAPLCGTPLLLHTLRAVAASDYITNIIIVTRPDLLAPIERLCADEKKLLAVVIGGESRTDSVLCGLASVNSPLVAIHDGARPLVTADVVDEAVTAAARYGAAAPAIAVKDTIKFARNGIVTHTPPRSTLFAVQTPQVFMTEQIRNALLKAKDKNLRLTDDCSAAEAAGLPVHLTQGSEKNIKITTPLDLTLAETLMKRRQPVVKIGHGYDVHRLKAGRKFILGGVEIPFECGPDGHSDADVLLHAVMDALIGAAGLRDIGVWFPDTEAEYQGASSLALLAQVMRALRERQLSVGNIDVTVIAQKPKLAEYIPRMRETLAAALDIEPICVNIKATTEEGLGFTGSGEGIACHAVCLLEEPGR